MLEAPIIGPIVGHLTSTSVRLMAGCKPTTKDKPNIGRFRVKKSSEPCNYGITKPLSDTSKDFFEGNGIGHVLIEGNSFQFTVHNHDEKRVIRVDLPI